LEGPSAGEEFECLNSLLRADLVDPKQNISLRMNVASVRTTCAKEQSSIKPDDQFKIVSIGDTTVLIAFD